MKGGCVIVFGFFEGEEPGQMGRWGGNNCLVKNSCWEISILRKIVAKGLFFLNASSRGGKWTNLATLGTCTRLKIFLWVHLVFWKWIMFCWTFWQKEAYCWNGSSWSWETFESDTGWGLLGGRQQLYALHIGFQGDLGGLVIRCRCALRYSGACEHPWWPWIGILELKGTHKVT